MVLLAVVGGGCAGDGDASARLAALVAAGEYTVAAGAELADGVPLAFAAEPEAAPVAAARESRPAVVLPPGVWRWRARVPADGRLQVGLWADAPVETTVTLVEESGTGARRRREVLEVARGRPEDGWLDLGVDLARWQGEEVVLELAAAGEARRVAWAPVALTAPPAPSARGRETRPNVLLIVVDTLRYDHLTPYGYERDTSPEIQRLLADRGLVVEDAYAQAPWTLPSAASYLASRQPAEILGDDRSAYGLPESLEVLAERFAGAGYATGGFVGNPTLHADNGFAQGFETFYSPLGIEALHEHAGAINRRALPWLAAHRDGPFFGYLHYIDPHDPYVSPDLVDGRSPYFEDPGGISGGSVHGIYVGRLELEDPERDLAHLVALYDTEIRTVDRAIGEVLEALGPEVLAETLVVLTSDHGEELFDHGGWKHGHTLYEEMIHVPLVARWDGRIPAGSRLPGTVRLLDLAPTLAGAAGIGPAPGWRGEDLSAVWRGEAELPRLAAFARHMTFGPLRAAAVLDGEKLFLYNETEEFSTEDQLQRAVQARDDERLARVERYDLEADPRERRNLAAAADARAGRPAPLDEILYRHLGAGLPGLLALSEALPVGAVLAGELEFDEPPEAVEPLFLAPVDRLELAGRRLTFSLVGEALAKGFRVLGVPAGPGAARVESLTLDGRALPPSAARASDGPFLAASGRPGLRLWWPPAADVAAEASPEAIDRTREALRNLGYIQ